jgi:Ca-activated chloride channel family protein
MTFYAEPDGRMMYNYYHTLNDRGEPDTLYADPVLDYTLQIHSNPPLIKTGVELVPNAYNIVEMPAARGRLNLAVSGASFGKNITCLVYRGGTREIVNVQPFNSAVHYLVGQYDLEILTLPRIKVSGLDIDQNRTTRFEIPVPGYVTFVHSYSLIGSVFVEENSTLKEIYQLSSAPNNETIALQPGRYRIVYRSRVSRSMQSTIERTFEIKSGGSKSIKL